MSATDTASPTESQVFEIARRAKVAARAIASAPRAVKDRALLAIAAALEASSAQIVAANGRDLTRAQEAGMSAGLLDRLALDPSRIAAIATALRELSALPDPVGDVVAGRTLAGGLRLRQVRVPMGVVGMIYEARPNVTVDAAGLALKAGNAVILRGGSAAEQSNLALVDVMRVALEEQGLPADLIQSVDEHGRAGAIALMKARGLVDVLIPRGGAGLIQAVVSESKVPVIETGVGNCHLYVEASADLDAALEITLNAKTQRVGVCNAIETLLVDAAIAETFLPQALVALAEAGVVIHGDDATADAAPDGVTVIPATPDDYETEFLALEIAVAVVDGIESALTHLRAYSSGHTEAIVTRDLGKATCFETEVDAAVVMVNASTRFTDGGEFGLGAEIGISTQKLHARGPMGLAALTSTKWIVHGDGHTRP
ncbi:MAG: glutamate-5-semialdehyde dehydrogenase [Promicromonosporaceae bacterium]|nr:glutamate-5-semialdehyde dehydrogenase [Promicromonosporaceae bacterium]